jgi:pyrroline-5-carboxylate reductase
VSGMKPVEEWSVGFIGAGVMASALAKGWLSAGLLDPARMAAFDLDQSRLLSLREATGLRAAASNADCVSGQDTIVIATKPAAVLPALKELRDILQPEQLVVSIAAGVTLASLEAAVPDGLAVIRVMPNTPCQIGSGAAGFSRGKNALPEHAAQVKRLFDAVGCAIEVPDYLMDAVTGLSGSGPAYLFIVIEALADGGVRAGIDRVSAMKLAAQTVLGAARLVLESGEHPGQLKDQVASPGGTTIAGLGVLESRAVRAAFMDAVDAATARSREIAV